MAEKEKNEQALNAKAKKEKKAKDKKEKNGLGKKSRELSSELKKVTWPTFKEVVKKTGVVLAVVAIFAVVIFGIDMLLSLLRDLLV